MSTIVVKEDTDRASASAARSSAALTAFGNRIVSEASLSMHVNVRQRARTDKADHRRLPRGAHPRALAPIAPWYARARGDGR
ncbi:MAG: hypothetical protein R3B06_22325 [Kofleriaceae bacterium]